MSKALTSMFSGLSVVVLLGQFIAINSAREEMGEVIPFWFFVISSISLIGIIFGHFYYGSANRIKQAAPLKYVAFGHGLAIFLWLLYSLGVGIPYYLSNCSAFLLEGHNPIINMTFDASRLNNEVAIQAGSFDRDSCTQHGIIMLVIYGSGIFFLATCMLVMFNVMNSQVTEKSGTGEWDEEEAVGDFNELDF